MFLPRLAVLVAPFIASPLMAQESVTIYRDTQTGTAHVVGLTDREAFYGAGYAAAQDRLFQMHWWRIRGHGRTAEFLGDGAGGENLDYDQRARLLGWKRHADAVYANMPQEHRTLLEYYARGVNDAVAAPGTNLHPLFSRVPWFAWQPRDCLSVWYQFCDMWKVVDLSEANTRRRFDEHVAENPTHTPQQIAAALWGTDEVVDDSAASVLQSDVSASLQADMQAFAQLHGIPPSYVPVGGVYSPSFSQGLVVAGDKVDTGGAVLVGTPRMAVAAPNILYEWHMEGGTFNVRGAGVAGCPYIVTGSSSHCAWSASSWSHDMHDLFRLKRDATTDRYWYEDDWHDFETHVETIFSYVGNGQPLASSTVEYRKSRWGPIITPLLSPSDIEPLVEYAAKYVPLDTASTSELKGFLGMYRASRVSELYAASMHWRAPSAGLVFADTSGSIGFACVGAIPVRSSNQLFPGAYALDGDVADNDWRTFVPAALRPVAINPTRGYCHMGNQIPIGSWYPLKSLILGVGDTPRSRLVRDFIENALQSSNGQVSESTLRDFIRDTTTPYVRDLTLIGQVLRDPTSASQYDFSPNADAALDLLEAWLQAGGHMEATHPGVVIAHHVNHSLLNLQDVPEMQVVVAEFGSRSAGLGLWLSETLRRLGPPPTGLPPYPPMPEAHKVVINWYLENAYADSMAAIAASGIPVNGSYLDFYRNYSLTSESNGGYRNDIRWWKVFAGPSATFSLADVPAQGLVREGFGPVRSNFTYTMMHAGGATYNQFVPLRNTDEAWSMLAIGVSEDAQTPNPHARSQKQLWEDGNLKYSPLRKASVVAISGPPLVLAIP